jgi:2-polyprenyl-6-methoxyphenol hydroxylase-like FAD-dependent oxidoreductase
MTREPRIVIIGAGLAGIATAVTLQRNGFHDFSILEKGTERRRSLALESLPRADVRRAVAALPVLVCAQTGLDWHVRPGR